MYKGGVMQNSRIPMILLFTGLALLSYQFLFHSSVKEQDFTKRLFVGRGGLAEDESTSGEDTTSDGNFKLKSRPQLPKLQQNQIAGLAPAVEVQHEEVAVAPTPAPLDMKALAKATDDKTKAGETKKKKKKKTVSPNPDSNAQKAAPVNIPVQTANTNQDTPVAPVIPEAPLATGNPGGAPSVNATANTNAIAKYYLNILLKEPNLTETQKFVAVHKAHQMTDDVYFAVATAMLADARPQMKDLAVYVYGQAINIKSFIALVNVLDTEHSNTVLIANSTKFLHMYSDVTASGTIPVLAQSLTMPKTTPSLHVEALKLLDIATKQYAQLEMSQPPPVNGQLGTFAYNPANAQKLFVPFVNILGTIIRTSTDANTKNIASQDLGSLQNLFGSQSASINQ